MFHLYYKFKANIQVFTKVLEDYGWHIDYFSSLPPLRQVIIGEIRGSVNKSNRFGFFSAFPAYNVLHDVSHND